MQLNQSFWKQIMGQHSSDDLVLFWHGLWARTNISDVWKIKKSSNISNDKFSDNILVMIGFYAGEEKKYNGNLPFSLLGAIAAFVMILSEVSSF